MTDDRAEIERLQAELDLDDCKEFPTTLDVSPPATRE